MVLYYICHPDPRWAGQGSKVTSTMLKVTVSAKGEGKNGSSVIRNLGHGSISHR